MSQLLEQLAPFKQAFYTALDRVTTPQELETVRTQFLGRNGQLTDLFKQLQELPLEQKKQVGPALNMIKAEVNASFDLKKHALETQENQARLITQKNFDVTAYTPYPKGTLHPYTLITEQIENIFMSMGFAIVDGPEVETAWYNFEALNIPADHPARDLHDTFWLTLPGQLLRTHTSSVEIRYLTNHKPPVAMIAPGRAYRHEATDATHDFVFMQIEGLVVDKNISLSHLLGTMKLFLQALFNAPQLTLRVRHSYFPFVEPGIEIDINCLFCSTGCAICKYQRWIELGGAGLTHPSVLQACNIDPEQWSGFAFGLGIERLAMLMYHIYDIRLFKTNKREFLTQF